MRVLIYTPSYRVEPETVQAALALARSWGDRGEGFACDWLLERENPTAREADPRGFYNVWVSYDKLHRLAQTAPYDAVLILESDIIPPDDALDEMTECMSETGADVVYAVYAYREGRGEGINITHRFTPKAGDCRNTGDSISLRKEHLEEAKTTRFYPCSGAGLGCVLVKTEVIAEIAFTLADAEWGTTGLHCDSYWNDAVWRKGYEQYAAMRAICGHKDTDGTIYYPNALQNHTAA